MGKRYQKKSATVKKRAKKRRSPGAQDPAQVDGVMSGMIGGFRRAIGVEKSSGSSSWNLLWTAILVAVGLGVAAWLISH